MAPDVGLPGPTEAASRPRRSCTRLAAHPAAASSSVPPPPPASRPRPTGRVLIVHANNKPYGSGPSGRSSEPLKTPTARNPASKPSNRSDFAFSCADYEAMRDSGVPYSGDPRANKLLPLPRPTYTEFINRAQRARMLDRLDFLYCAADAPKPPRIDASRYEVVIWCGVSFRRFTRLWTPERSHFFPPSFQARALAALCCAHRLRAAPPADGGTSLADLPAEIVLDIIAASASKADAAKEDYDDLKLVCSGARHLFLPAPGSSGVRDHLYDAAFGL